MKVSSQTRQHIDVAHLYRLLAGHWRLERVVEDWKAGQTVTLTGTASFAPDQTGLLQCDAGRLCLPEGQTLDATQSYRWRFGDAAVWVDYADGRPFIALRAPFDQPDSAHQCGDDHYQVAFDFRKQAQWTSRWEVHGPRKNYVMKSTYSRA